MFKIFKLAAIATAATGLLLGGIQPANAAPAANLTYAQFTATDGYKDLSAASTASGDFISNQTGLRMSVTNTMTDGENVAPLGNVLVEATKTKMKMTVSAEDVSFSAWVVDGFAYYSQSQYISNSGGNVPSTLFSRISGSKDKLVQSSEISSDVGLTAPDKLFSNGSDSTLNKSLNPYAELMSMFQFSEVTKTVDAENPEAATYEFDMSLSFLGQVSVIHEKVEFNGDYTNKITITTQSGTAQVSNVIDFEIDNEIVVDVPDISMVITESTVKKVTKQIAAEGKLYPQATSIVKKATTLAKAGKTAIAQKHLMSAATALKLKFTKITNGVKLTTKFQSVSGSVCITAVKGKTSTKHC